MNSTGIVLAAGKGTRMVSELPKALHRMCGLPMTEHCVRAIKGAGAEPVVVVVGHGADQVREALGEGNIYAVQEQQLGTGHALMQALPALRGDGVAMVMPGDAPLVTSESLRSLRAAHEREGAAMTLAVCRYADPTGYGRVLRSSAGNPVEIVEERDCTPEQRAITEVCVSLYCFNVGLLRDLLPRLSSDNAQGEYYLTEIVSLAAKAGCKVATWETTQPEELVGVNDRWQLAAVGKSLRMRKLKEMALAGVTIVDPDTCFADMDVEVGTDTTIEPSCYLIGSTRIGAGCTIGPGTRMKDSVVADDSIVLSSNVVESRIGSRTRVGPFAHLRPESEIGNNCVIGDFVEVKKSRIMDRVSVGHLAYIGDSVVGEGTNIGAGTITCNYDGKRKNQTIIGAGVFIGSNNTLVAPVKIGDGAFTAAGSTITDDVEDNALALGRARQIIKEGWAEQWRKQP